MNRVPLLSVENLTTQYYTENGWVKAVDNVSFELDRAQSLGIVGESGCGKTSLAFSLMKLLQTRNKTEGKIMFDSMSILDMPEKDFRNMRWKRISIIPQAAMGALNPIYTIGDQIIEAITAHSKISRPEAMDMTESLLEQVGIDSWRVRNYPHELSGGMCQRAIIAMALALSPDLVIADEPTTALDAVTQVQILKLLKQLQSKLNISLIYISHDLSILGQICDRIAVMYAGKIIETGYSKNIYTNPRHPYTKALLGSFPDLKSDGKSLTGLAGSPPDILNYPAGCRFHPRCPVVQTGCKINEPVMTQIGPGQSAACHCLPSRSVL